MGTRLTSLTPTRPSSARSIALGPCGRYRTKLLCDAAHVTTGITGVDGRVSDPRAVSGSVSLAGVDGDHAGEEEVVGDADGPAVAALEHGGGARVSGPDAPWYTAPIDTLPDS
jgi:hypothetical protein